MAESLKNRTIKGTLWSAADAFLGQGVTFIVGIILARLLTPEEYGLIGICTIFTVVLSGIVDSGFSNALIRKKEVSEDDYNTMFITNMVMSILLYVMLFWGAPLLASFFKRLELIKILRVMGVLLILQALSITQVTILTKRIDFKTKTKASLISASISGIIGITMAYSGFGVWSLVGQQLSKQFLYSVSLWGLNKWWPKMKFSKGSFHYMWGFGWKIMLSGLLNNIWSQMTQLVVAKYYSPSSLGQYTRSKEYAHLLSQNLTSIIQRVTYPVLSEVQDEKERMVAAYRKAIKITMFVTAVLMVFMGAVAEPLVYCLIGPQWHEAATYLPLICITMSLYPLHAINLNMLQVQGRSDIYLYLEVIKKIIYLLPIACGVFINIYLMLVASLFVGIVNFFLNSYYTGRDLGYSSWMQLRDIAPDYGIALAVALPVYFLKFFPFSYWVILPVQIIVGIIIFVVMCRVTRNDEFKELFIIIKTVFPKRIPWIKRH